MMLQQKLFEEFQDVGDMMYKYICRQRGSCSSILNATEFLSGVQDIIDFGGEANAMDFYFDVFSGGQSLSQNGIFH